MKTISKLLVYSALLLTAASAKQGDAYLGLQWDGLSGKYDVTDKVSVQAIVGLWGYSDLTNITGKVNYKFQEKQFYNYYGYGSVSYWSWDNAFYDESVIGAGIGIGAEYDIRGLDKDFIPLYLSFDLGVEVASFDYYNDFSSLGIGFGAHYKF